MHRTNTHLSGKNELGEDITVTSEEIKAVAEKINKKLDEIAESSDDESKDVKKN